MPGIRTSTMAASITTTRASDCVPALSADHLFSYLFIFFIMPTANQTQVQIDDLKSAFNRARLYQLNITFEEAVLNKALNIALTRMAFAYLNPQPKKRHWQDREVNYV
jgi:hypothetical protein